MLYILLLLGILEDSGIRGGGNKYAVYIEHPDTNDIWSFYLHMANGANGASYVNPSLYLGEYVDTNTLLGYQGNYSGANNSDVVHLHVQLSSNNNYSNAIDPTNYFGLNLNYSNSPHVGYLTNYVTHPQKSVPSTNIINGVQFKDRLYEASYDDNGNIKTKYYDNLTKQWSNTWDISLGGAGIGTINLTVFGNNLFLALRGKSDNNIYYNVLNYNQSTSAYKWAGWQSQLGGSIQSDIITSVSNGKLYLGVITSDGYLRLNSTSDLVSWDGFQAVGSTFIGNPAMGTIGNQLIVSGRGSSDDYVYTRTFDTGLKTWGTWTNAGSVSRVVTDVNLVDFSGKIYQFFVHYDDYLRYRTTVDGVNWSGYTTIGGTLNSNVSTTVTQDNKRLFFAFKGTDSNVYTNYIDQNNIMATWINQGGGVLGNPSLDNNSTTTMGVNLKMIGNDQVYRYRPFNIDPSVNTWGQWSIMY